MTKSQHRELMQRAPMGAEGLAQIRAIVANHQFAKVNETAIDGYTASIIVQVFENLNPTNQSKLLALPVWRVAAICYKLVSK